MPNLPISSAEITETASASATFPPLICVPTTAIFSIASSAWSSWFSCARAVHDSIEAIDSDRSLGIKVCFGLNLRLLLSY
jgi:hypothetical protein